jgi:hypothetical protein
MDRKLVLIVVDSLRTDMLRRAVAEGEAPNFGALLDRGELVPDCVSSFPSVTPVCCSDIVTGARPADHRVSGMNWYHRGERRYVEYGSSMEATRAFGMFRTLYDVVYNLNMSHLSGEVETVFERLADAGVRTACTPFLIYRGRTRHELGLEGVLRRVAVAADFRHAVWGPQELFYGELYASRKVPCRPTLARPGTRDEYTACVGRELVAGDLYDFLLFSLPDHDYHCHRFGPERSVESIAKADRCFGEIVDEAGGMDAFLAANAVILMADHAQTPVESELRLADLLGAEWRVLGPASERPEEAELAVSPSARAAGVYVLDEGPRFARVHERVRRTLLDADGADLVAWLAEGGAPADSRSPGVRSGGAPSPAVEAVVGTGGRELRFRPGTGAPDLRDRGWDTDGDLTVLGLELRDGALVSDAYPDALARLWSALRAPQAGDLLASLAPGSECADWGGASHIGGGSHGGLDAGDSLVPLLATGFPEGWPQRRRQWTLGDAAGLVLEHFGVAEPAAPGPEAAAR